MLICINIPFSVKLKATGDIVDEDNAPNGLVTGWDYANEKFDMKVPERILVVGQDQHIGNYNPYNELNISRFFFNKLLVSMCVVFNSIFFSSWSKL